MRATFLTIIIVGAGASGPAAVDRPLSGLAWAVALAVALVGVLRDRPALTRAAAPAAGVLWGQMLLFPLPPGIFLLGLILGLLAGLVALGLALIYRANRVLNFAQAELGVAPTIVTVGLVTLSGLPWLVAVPIGLVLAVVLGLVVEAVIIRRFSRAPRLVLTVATIGLSQLLTVVSILLPRLWGAPLLSGRLDVPIDVTFTVDPLRITGDHLLALVVAPAVVVALVLFLRRTLVGLAVQAVSESTDRALLLGIPARRLQTVVWCLATVLSFVGLVLRAGVVGMPVASTLSFGALLLALAALVLGNLTDLPAVVASASALGVLEQGIIWNNPDQTTLVTPILGAVIVLALLVRRTGTSRAERDDTSSWTAAAAIRPIPAELRDLVEVRVARIAATGAGLLLVATLPLWASPSTEVKAAVVACFVLVAASVVVLTGWAGQVSLGQMSFAAVGAVVGALVTGRGEADLSLALLAAAAAGAVAAAVLGLPALRLRGMYLAVVTLAFAVASSQFLLNRSRFSWLPSRNVARPRLFGVFDLSSQRSVYWVAATVAVLGLLAVRGVRSSRAGRVLLAQRENEQAAASYGIDVVRAKLVAFALAGAVAAVAGCLYVHILMGYSEQPYEPAVSFNVFTAAVVGGLGSLAGAVLGALFLNGGQWLLSPDWQLLPSAVGVLAVLLLLPGGLGELAYRGRDALLRRLAARRGLVVPSLVVDGAGEAGGRNGAVPAGGPGADPEPVGRLAGAPGADGAPGPDGAGGADALLRVRALDVRYGEVRVLFGVDLDVREGEIVALLGTNGAGKSTLLNAVSGLVPARRGTVRLAGRDITHVAPDRIAALGIGQVPGGKGVFPGLSVDDNLRVASWMVRADRAVAEGRRERVRALFPVLRERGAEPAADLSGGQQQMLALAMAFVVRPRLLVIDELSLGLAPSIVDQLLDIVRTLRDEGTTILLVEQSVNVALSLADRAYVMEKGEVRFEGRAADLLGRPDVLRSVFLEGAARGLATAAAPAVPAPAPSPVGAGSRDRPTAGAAPAGPPALEAEDLSVRFGGIVAVDGVSLRVARGEVVGVIGPNGAGKTTVFDLLSGHTRADAGTLALAGVDLTGRSAAARARAGLGRSYQDSRLFPALTVEEAIAVALDRWVAVRDVGNAVLRTPALVLSEAEVAAEVERLVDLLGLGALRSTFVGELSTGSRRVVDLACVLAHRPSVVLLDEPSSGIAQREAEALGPLLARVRDTLGASLVVVEHDMALITAVSDRLIALDRGRVVAEGRPGDVIHHPDVVASYLGTNRTAIDRSGPAPAAAAPTPAPSVPPVSFGAP